MNSRTFSTVKISRTINALGINVSYDTVILDVMILVSRLFSGEIVVIRLAKDGICCSKLVISI